MASYAAGDAVVGTSWQIQVNLLQADDQPIAGVLPDEGSTGWSDTWMIASKAKNPNCMYMWMDHMASAEANGQATVWFGEAATSQAACDYAETIAPGHCELTHATDEAYYDKIWYWSTPQADCADEDAATTCKDQDAWVAAWTKLRGA
jgi:putative spermidine/putrescine transport system substrate-binding protein